MKITDKCVHCETEGRLTVARVANHITFAKITLRCHQCDGTEDITVSLAPVCRACDTAPAMDGTTLCEGCLAARIQRGGR